MRIALLAALAAACLCHASIGHADTTTAPAAAGVEVPPDAMAPATVQGHPLTAVVVTQCNLVVAVYMTFPDGRLMRFDQSDHLPYDVLMSMAYAATRSERVEVSCNDNGGVVGYEKHEPI